MPTISVEAIFVFDKYLQELISRIREEVISDELAAQCTQLVEMHRRLLAQHIYAAQSNDASFFDSLMTHAVTLHETAEDLEALALRTLPE